jgi:hypothetical protein
MPDSTMKLWLGAEIEADIADGNKSVRKEIESTINQFLNDKTYDLALKQINLIVILRNDTIYKERTIYSPNKQEMDFRLALNYQAFKAASHQARCKMYISLILRATEILQTKGLNQSALTRLHHDVSELGKQYG